MLTTTAPDDTIASSAPMPRPPRADENQIATLGRHRPPLTASEISALVGGLDLETARAHHVEMAAVVAELARSADMDWPWTLDDPTVALLRAIARMALVAPDAVSDGAVALRRSLGASAPELAGQVSS